MVLDINSLLEPIGADSPCGVDLESSAIAELDRLAQGKAEQQIGSTVVAAEGPDWNVVQREALNILTRSKDLRAATQLAKALLRTGGWAGFATGLAALGGIIERYWDGLYPLLDPEDDKDPTMRVNILMSITDAAVLAAIRITPLVVSRTFGRFSLKEIDLAAGEGTAADANGSGAITMASIEAAAVDTELDALQQAAASVRECASRLAAFEAALGSHVEVGKMPTFTKLAALIHAADKFLGSMVARRVPSAETALGEGGGANGAPGGGGSLGSIRSREDVTRALDAISAYYERNEPSSPIPIFVARCKRLVMMGFVDIVRELVPDALSQVDVLRGHVE